MSRGRTNSSPELFPLSCSHLEISTPDDSNLQGLAANVKLLLKLIEDHNEACTKDHDGRKMQRVAGMITILDEVKSRIQKSQSLGTRRREAELRRCNTELRPHHNNVPPRDHHHHKKQPPPQEPITSTDEKERLQRELNASLAARKSLERMFSSLGKEKEIMAAELARKVQELNGNEEHLNDLRAQNEILLTKVQTCAAMHKGISRKQCGGGDHAQEINNHVALQERNKELSEQLLKSLDGYRSLKRKLKEAHEEKEGVHTKMVEIEEQVEVGIHRISGIRERIIVEAKEEAIDDNIEEELTALENLFRSIEISKSKHPCDEHEHEPIDDTGT